MEHITTEYGSPCNLLKLTREEYKALDTFLIALGVRARVVKSHYESPENYEKGIETIIIQAENPYEDYLITHRTVNDTLKRAYTFAKENMEPDSLYWYKST